MSQPAQKEQPAPAYFNRVDTRAAAPVAPISPPSQETAQKPTPDYENVPAPTGPFKKAARRRGNPYLIITIIILAAIVVMLVFLYISRI
jgi:hypothetical protein